MFKKIILKNYQRKINKLNPQLNISLNMEMPTPCLREVAVYSALVAKINSFEEELKSKEDSFFKEKTFFYRKLIKEKTEKLTGDDYFAALDKLLEEILPFYFACVREAARRTLKMRHFDVQILGGIVLHRNKIAEMATGEGKTLVATLPASLNALTGRGVHIVTVNDYLARRDKEWMQPVYEFLGLSVGVIQQDMSKEERKLAYSCDITYGTNNEFGFDYLRDNMVISLEEMVQRGHFYAIVDEVDSILIDEARTPLIISGPSEVSTDKYYLAERAVRNLKVKFIIQSYSNKQDDTLTIKNIDGSEEKVSSNYLEENYDAVVEEKTHTSYLTEKGEKKCEEFLKVKSLEESPDKFSPQPWTHYLSQSLRAHYLFKRDRDYITKDGKVVIVDEFTGRLMPGRRWSDGLHQAVEAKEGLKIQEESQTLATITLQNYFRMYKKLAGMTGTAYTEANEFKHIYNLEVVVIPTNRPLIRTNFADRIYKTKRAKFTAVIAEIEELYKKERPVLVGTTSIEDSEELSFLLQKKGIPHNVLNAKYHEREAYIVAQAGRRAQITIATNMAGRGTDIILGGNLDYFIKDILLKNGITPEDEDYKQQYEKLYQQYLSKFQQEHKKVVELGGLHIIGTQRHEARRIDNQLRGRAGRQGDPGSSRFYVSLEDDLMRLFGSEKINFLMERFGFPEDEPIEHPLITRSLAVAQKRVEAHNFEIRKQLLQYDDVMNKQREVIYSWRKEVLASEDLREHTFEMIDEVIEKNASLYLQQEPDLFGLIHWYKQKFSLTLTTDEINNLTDKEIISLLKEKAKKFYQQRREREAEEFSFLEKWALISAIDSRWKEHLLIMDNLKEGIHLRGYAHSDPVVEYQKESYYTFSEMLDSIKEGTVEMIFKAKLLQDKEIEGVFAQGKKFSHPSVSAIDSSSEKSPFFGKENASSLRRQEIKVSTSHKKIGRNQPCPCGSGRKYKKCCGR